MKQDSFDTDKLKSIGIGIALLTGTLGAGYYFVKREVNAGQEKRAIDQSFDPGNPNNFALRLRMAITNDHWYQWWADFNSLVQIFKEIPSKLMYKKTEGAYATQFKRSLNTDLKDKLTQKELNTLLALYAKKKEK